MMTKRRAKKMRDSFIITLRTTSIAPKKRIESRYRSSLIQNIGAEKAVLEVSLVLLYSRPRNDNKCERKPRLTQKVITKLIKMSPLLLPHRMSKSNDPRNQTRSKKAIKNQIKHIPKPNIKPSNLVNLTKLVAQEAQCKHIKHNLNEIKISGRIDGVDSSSIKA